MTPRATMRLQFHKGFTFADAEPLAPYFAQLGISHVYASPITTARAGSMHGYDVIDPTKVNPELGGEDALRRLVSALRKEGLGLIVDIVPNHMAAAAENAWWFDVLKHGQQSRYAPYFDIDWNAEDEALRGKVLLPVLGKSLSDALRDGEITLAREGGELILEYFQHRFPIAEGSARDTGDIAAVLARQNYRLTSWRVANDEINWRRFFDINELVALRMEHAAAFEDAHALIFRLYAEGLVDGVRIDHIDGLSDPAAYCRALRARLDELESKRPTSAPHGRAYLVVEKILLRGETLPNWSCDGTSGYDFMNEVSAVQHDAAGEDVLNRLWEQVSGRSADFEIEEQAARREMIARSFSAQLDACAATFHRLARAEGNDISRESIRRALIELLAHFPIYRTYTKGDDDTACDAPFVAAATAKAKATGLPLDRDIIDQLSAWLLCPSSHPELQAEAITQFQQLSAPVAAKSVEDTAFYRYGRLLSRNDVGFDVTRFADSTADFHANARHRMEGSPHAMLATATHDHKRGEDVRARLAVLSELSAEWAEVVPRWISQCVLLRAANGTLPHAADIAILFQMIVGAWPLDLSIDDNEGRRAFAERLTQWQEKALREAKLVTDWSVPNDSYEWAARELLLSLVAQNKAPDLLHDIINFAGRISPAGAVNGLAQTLLKLTAPGVPDIYQGTEFWDFSLVDPDNRRPVDFAARITSLDTPAPLDELTQGWRDGRIKQFVTARTLVVRREHPELFADGSYEPLEVRGALADHVVAFARRAEGKIAITIVPRAASRLLREDGIFFGDDVWKDTVIGTQNVALRNVFDDRRIVNSEEPIAIGDIFAALPVALLVSDER